MHKVINKFIQSCCYFVLFVLIISSCSPKKKQEQVTQNTPIYSLELSYAKQFTVDYFEGYKKVSVYSPWKENELLATYYLVEKMEQVVPTDGDKILIPLKDIAVNSCSHIGLLNALHLTKYISGVCSPKHIYNSELKEGCEKGEIKDLGDAFAMNKEKLITLSPAAVMLSGYEQGNEQDKRIKEAGIPVITNIEWTENHPLGRAEWMKFIATFFNQEDHANRIFQTIESNYLDLKELGGLNEKKKEILAGLSFKGTWYMPGGKSFMGQFFSDAGGKYHYQDDTSTGSLPLSFETVLMHFKESDIWLGANVSNKQQLIEKDDRFSLFSAYQNNNVYNYDKRTTHEGGNDFWESAIARPDRLLKDFILVLQPSLLKQDTCFYIRKLN